jgi:hypothetical protein
VDEYLLPAFLGPSGKMRTIREVREHRHVELDRKGEKLLRHGHIVPDVVNDDGDPENPPEAKGEAEPLFFPPEKTVVVILHCFPPKAERPQRSKEGFKVLQETFSLPSVLKNYLDLKGRPFGKRVTENLKGEAVLSDLVEHKKGEFPAYPSKERPGKGSLAFLKKSCFKSQGKEHHSPG